MTRRLAGACARPEFWLWMLLLWTTMSALRSLHSPWMRSALTEWLRWGAGIGLTLALGQWLTRTRLAARLAVVCTGLITVVGIWDGLETAHGGLIGPFRDHQLCGSALLTLLPFSLASGLTARDPRWRMGAQLVAMAGLISLVMTETRSAWIGAAVAGVTFAGLWWRRTRIETGRRQAKQLLVPILLFIGVGLYFVGEIGVTEFQQSLSVRAGSLSALNQDGSWQQRLHAWQGAERMVAARPLSGWGLGRYPGIQWRFSHVGRVLEPTERPSLSEQAHDLYLQTTAEIGLIGLLLFLAVLISFGARSWRALRQATGQPARSRDGFLVATLTLIAGWAVDALASPSYQFAEVSLFVWAMLGIGLAALNRRERTEVETVLLSAPVTRVLRLAASGALSLVVLSQFIPLGLLGPVEAYAPPSGYSYDSVTLIGSKSVAAVGDVVTYTLTAQYHDSQGIHLVNVSTDNPSSFVATGPPNGAAYGTFSADTTANTEVYTVPAAAAGRTLTVFGAFKDRGVNHSATTALQVMSVSP